MSEIFLKIINMSISASYIVLAVFLLRLLLKKAPKWIAVVLWGIVALRLVCPFTVESVLSLIPSAEVVAPDIMMDRTPEINTGIPIVNQVINPVISGSFTPDPATSANPLQLWIPTFALVWIVGMVAMLIYSAVSYIRLKRKIGTAVLLRDNIYQSENVVSPFVLGIIKPRIYLPFGMNEQDMAHVIAHEQAHVRRKDHIWKPLGFLLLTLHWFNPFMWLGYVLLCRDIELACDEKVIEDLDHDARADYSQALLSCSVNRRIIAACPLAFGEVGVKDRVKSVLSYKKPAFWIIIVAIIVCVVLAVCFLTDPPSDNKNNDVNPSNEIYTDHDGVYVAIKSIDINAGSYKVFNLVWHNDTEEEVTYGSYYSIEYKDGDKWVDVLDAPDGLNITFTDIAYFLSPHTTATKSYSTQLFDISKNGTYRLIMPFWIGGSKEAYYTWIVFKVGEGADTTTGSDSLRAQYLREQYPECFDLDASKGLDVYVAAFAKDYYVCKVFPHQDAGRRLDELIDTKGFSVEDMRAILSTYKIDYDDVYIIPWQDPVSSYIGEWWLISDGEDPAAKKQAHIEHICQILFGSNSEVQGKCTLIYHSPVYSYVMSDVPTIVIENNVIYTVSDGGKIKLGAVEEIALDTSNFDALFYQGGFDYSELANELRTNNEKAYEVNYTTSADGIEIYYIMKQKTGETFIVYGHYGNGERLNEIRWIYSISQ